MSQLLHFDVPTIDVSEWPALLVGKTVRAVRPAHDRGAVPDVHLMFTDNTAFVLSVKAGVFFEACMLNTLRKAQPIAAVQPIHVPGDSNHYLEIRSRTFPMMHLIAVNREIGPDEFPFELRERESPYV